MTSSPMFRFTIRDVLWLMVVVAILSLWAVERQGKKLVDYWFRNSRYQGQLHNRIEEQSEQIQKLTKQLKAEQNWRDDLMRSQSPELAEEQPAPPPPP